MNVLSLFDGMSCGQIALNKLGFKIENYFASEIDKHAIQVTKTNYPNTQHVGDVTLVKGSDLPKIDLLIGGSPCQGFSKAGKMLNFDDPRSKLFFEFVRLLKETNPKYFLLENVVMKQEHRDVISEFLGVQPILIDSAIFSAQRRKRLYWTNIPLDEIPEDKGIKLLDIVDHEFSDEYIMSLGWQKWFESKKEFLYNKYLSINPEKARTMTARQYANWNGNFLFLDRKILVREATKKGFVEILDGQFVDLTFINSKTRRGRKMDEKSNCLTASNFDYCQFKIDNYSNGFFRRLTPIECERLQTVPDNYTSAVSDRERYKMLGNGWTVDVVAFLMKNIKK